MKHFMIVLLAVMFLAMPADARWHHHRHFGHGYYVADVAAGIVGTTAGIMLAREIMDAGDTRSRPRPRVYVVEPEGRCYTIVSRKTGKVTQKCVEHASEEIIYVD